MGERIISGAQAAEEIIKGRDEARSVDLSNAEINGSICVDGLTIVGDLDFQDTYIYGDLKLMDMRISGVIDLRNTEITGVIDFVGTKAHKIYADGLLAMAVHLSLQNRIVIHPSSL